jgi:hypothetical protein
MTRWPCRIRGRGLWHIEGLTARGMGAAALRPLRGLGHSPGVFSFTVLQRVTLFRAGGRRPPETPCWGSLLPQTPISLGYVGDCCERPRTRRVGRAKWRGVRGEWGKGPVCSVAKGIYWDSIVMNTTQWGGSVQVRVEPSRVVGKSPTKSSLRSRRGLPSGSE